MAEHERFQRHLHTTVRCEWRK